MTYVPAAFGNKLTSIQSYKVHLALALQKLDTDAVEAAAQYVFGCWRDGGVVWCVGNGGSMATASHAALDLSKWTEVRAPDGKPHAVHAAALDSAPMLTAWANDADYNEVFERQLRTRMAKEDVLLAISTSGMSGNVVLAAGVARNLGAAVIALTGIWRSSLLAERADIAIHVEGDIRIQEDLHLAVCHMIAGRVKELIVAEVGA